MADCASCHQQFVAGEKKLDPGCGHNYHTVCLKDRLTGKEDPLCLVEGCLQKVDMRIISRNVAFSPQGARTYIHTIWERLQREMTASNLTIYGRAWKALSTLKCPKGLEIHTNNTIMTNGARFAAEDTPDNVAIDLSKLIVLRFTRAFTFGDERVEDTAALIMCKDETFEPLRKRWETMLYGQGKEPMHVSLIPQIFTYDDEKLDYNSTPAKVMAHVCKRSRFTTDNGIDAPPTRLQN